MKRISLLLLLLGGPFFLMAQDCACLDDLDYAAAQIAEQHPGYSYFSRGRMAKDYRNGLNALREEVSQNCNVGQEACASYLNRFFAIIPDKFLRATVEVPEVYDPSVPEDTTEAPIRPLTVSITPIDTSTALIELSSFGQQYTEQLDSFYAHLDGELDNYWHLVIDLRANGGGRRTNMHNFMKILEDDSHELVRIAVLQSRRTSSAAEHFLFESRRDLGARIRTFGQNSYGALAYGGAIPLVTPNFGIQFRLPTEVFRRFRPYERVGVEPDVRTTNSGSIDAALEWIRH